jgi:TetR/AcrR family acrAB operon transcriptional repressor
VRRTKEEAAATRAQILDAALRVFSRKGYSGTTLEDVAAEAGVTRGAVYWHFKGKADLYTALLQERTAKLGGLYEEALSPGGGRSRSPLASLERLLIRSLEYLQEDPAYRAVMELSWFKTELSPELAAGFQQKIASTRRLVDMLAELIRAGIAAGEIAPTIDPHASALAAVSLLTGAMGMYLMDPAMLGSKATIKRVVQTFIRGLRA